MMKRFKKETTLFPQTTETASDHPASLERLLDKVSKRFYDTIDFFKNRHIAAGPDSKKKKLHQLPWYLMIGPANAGKTSLLLNSGIPFVLAKKTKVPMPTKDCDWWVSPHQVFLDINGNLVFPKHHQEKMNALWQHLSTLPAEVRGKKALAGIVLVLDVIDLFQQTPAERKTQLQTIAAEIKHLYQQYHKAIPLTLILNKADAIPGFESFFSGLSPNKRQQAFGIKLPLENDASRMKSFVSTEFTKLLDTLNQSLMVRFNEETQLHRREEIKEFPLQLENLRKMILTSVRVLIEEGTALMSGIYFTSAVPQQQRLLASPNPNEKPSNTLSRSKPFFTHELLTRVLTYKTLAASHRKAIPQKKSITIALTIFIIIGVVLASVWTVECLQERAAIRKASQALMQYEALPAKTQTTLSAALPPLMMLDKVNQALNHAPPLVSFLDSRADKMIAARIKLIVNQQFQTRVFPWVTQSLQDAMIQSYPTKNNVQLYNALQLYLMLNQPTHFDSAFVQMWLPALLSQTTLSYEDLSGIAVLLQEQFQDQNLPSFPLDQNLVTTAQTTLSQLSVQDLAFVILKAEETPARLTLPIKTTSGLANQIPLIYTAEYFNKLYHQKTEDAAFMALSQNWILGTHPTSINSSALAPLTQQVQASYLSNYQNQWKPLEEALNKNPNVLVTSEDAPALIALIENDIRPVSELNN